MSELIESTNLNKELEIKHLTNTISKKEAAANQKQSANYHKDTAFTLKRWNLVAMWSWDVECEVCAICRTPLMGKDFFMA